MKNSIVTVAAVAAALLFIPLRAAAQQDDPANVTCENSTISGGTFNNVTVPAGFGCTLRGTKVTGNVTLGKGAGLEINNFTGTDTTIAGNVTGDGCLFILLDATQNSSGRIVIGGDLTITNCTSANFSGGVGRASSPASVLIGGSVQCQNNPGSCQFLSVVISGNLKCSGNSTCALQSDVIEKNVTINNNTGALIFLDALILTNTVIGGDLACSGNSSTSPTPPNTVAGTESGQCSGF